MGAHTASVVTLGGFIRRHGTIKAAALKLMVHPTTIMYHQRQRNKVRVRIDRETNEPLAVWVEKDIAPGVRIKGFK